MSPIRIQSVLFDLDGTFADTAPDLAHALNQTLTAHGRKTLSLEEIRPVVSHGGKALIELGFKITDSHADFEALRLELLEFYKKDIAKHTQLFEGIEALLNDLRNTGICWGIVTNKPSWLTEPLMHELGIAAQACSIVSGDTLTVNKPHPEPLLHAASECQVDAQACLYIGDAERDIIAGKRANMLTMVANYGYIHHGDNPKGWQADAYIDHPNEIFDWISQYNEQLTNDERTAN